MTLRRVRVHSRSIFGPDQGDIHGTGTWARRLAGRSTPGCIVTPSSIATVRTGLMNVPSPIACISCIAVAVDNVACICAIDLYVAQIRVNIVICAGYADSIARVSNDRGAAPDDGDGDVRSQVDHVTALYMNGIRVTIDEDSIGSAQIDAIRCPADRSPGGAPEADRVTGGSDVIVAGIRAQL